jgi:hypothetical protein
VICSLLKVRLCRTKQCDLFVIEDPALPDQAMRFVRY